MSDIITITLNPCIDKSTSVSGIQPDKKLRCTPPVFDPGGGGINVSRAIKNLGGEALAIYPSGGYSGVFLNQLLARESIPVLNIQTKQHTRENMIAVDTMCNQQYRFGMPGPLMEVEEWQRCLEAVEHNDSEYIVASGSLPPGVPVDFYAKLALIAKRDKRKLIVDTSGEALRHAVKEGVYLIKPNLGELSSLVGENELETNEIEPIAKDLILNGGSEIVVVSLGAQGAMLITKDVTYKVDAPIVKRKTTVGAGDSMVAGIVFSITQGENLRHVLRYGVACGTAATLNAGTSLCSRQDVERLYKQIQNEK
ncbi:1-phosphofructokinase family hexose kinase [Membranicola marinus]|uniref:1-phosphofructokinase family hexose kinase n=1 Tax=Membranihabitans marinus TaxID=1227546 RepID=A0A953I0F2_9BACT|nr:1-phosphofructokinase family hexose kinase [Membranihabitans marinus]MBY5958997.1 1-phosphofructokinase family hexose kinase [Membranihabitans marinus]